MKSTACGPSYDYPGDENLVKLKDCTTDARAHVTSLIFFFFCEKNSSISVISFFNFNYTYPGTSIFSRKKKKKERKKETSITAILTIKSMKSVYLRA